MRAYQDRYKCIPLIKTQTQKWNKLNRWRQIFTRKRSLSLFFSTRCIFGFTRMTVSRGRSSRVPRLPHRKQEMAVGWWRLFLSGHSISDCLRYIRWRIECWPFLGLFSSSGCIFFCYRILVVLCCGQVGAIICIFVLFNWKEGNREKNKRGL